MKTKTFYIAEDSLEAAQTLVGYIPEYETAELAKKDNPALAHIYKVTIEEVQ